jgi:hypothetical protein
VGDDAERLKAADAVERSPSALDRRRPFSERGPIEAGLAGRVRLAPDADAGDGGEVISRRPREGEPCDSFRSRFPRASATR